MIVGARVDQEQAAYRIGHRAGNRLLTGFVAMVFGSNFNDTLIGDGNDNFLRGGSGGDSLDGAGGIDTADYNNATAGLVVNLAAARVLHLHDPATGHGHQ